MEEAGEEPFGGEEVKAVMELGVQTLKERIALAGHLIALATAALGIDADAPIVPEDGRLLLTAAFATELKSKSGPDGQPFDEPPQWTWDVVREGLEELSEATDKTVETILLAVCRSATRQREQMEVVLKAGVPKLELALVQYGTALTNEYHSKVLGRLTKLLALYGQAQAARLGLNIVQPVGSENGENGDVHG
jgi:hypothetical protein